MHEEFIFLIPPILRGIDCTHYAKKKKGHRACSRAKDNRFSLPCPLTAKQYRALVMRAYSSYYVIFMRSRGCAVQY